MSEEEEDYSPEQREALEKLKREKGIPTEPQTQEINIKVKSEKTQLAEDMLQHLREQYELEGAQINIDDIKTREDYAIAVQTLRDLRKEAQKGGERRGGSGTAPLSSEGSQKELETRSYENIEDLISDIVRHASLEHEVADEASKIEKELLRKALIGQKKLDRPISVDINPIYPEGHPKAGKPIPYKEIFDEEARKRLLLKKKLEKEDREQ